MQCWACQEIVCKHWCAEKDHARSLVIPAAFQECPRVALRFRRLQSLQQASVQYVPVQHAPAQQHARTNWGRRQRQEKSGRGGEDRRVTGEAVEEKQ